MSNAPINVRARLVGQGIELRRLHHIPLLSREPFTIEVEGGGTAVLFRFGVVVLCGVSPMAEASLLELLKPYIRQSCEPVQAETLVVQIVEGAEEGINEQGLVLPRWDLAHLQVVADILAKSELIDRYEQGIAATFDRIEPLAEEMQARGRVPRQANALLRHIGDLLQIQHRMVGRAQVGEKPEVLWDYPELERLWNRLENEYELSERQVALERKLDLIANTVETLLDLLQNRRSLRVEWYIVILIVIEIGLTLYELFIHD